jgi:hypothetical protein
MRKSTVNKIICHKSNQMYIEKYFDFHTKYDINMQQKQNIAQVMWKLYRTSKIKTLREKRISLLRN